MVGWRADGVAWAAATGQQRSGVGGATDVLFGLAFFVFFCWIVIRAARGLFEWNRRRYVEREARYQAEIEMRKREIIREQEGRDH
jgi:hypothetical protein